MATHTHTRRALFGAMAIAPIVIAAPALGETSRFDALRLEWLQMLAGTEAIGDDDDPRFQTMNSRMLEIEGQIVAQPAQNLSDAKAKLRFVVATNAGGLPLDGEQAHKVIADATRFLA